MAKGEFFLKNMPRGSGLRGMASFYPGADVGAIEVFSALLNISSELLSAINSSLSRHGTSQARFRLLLMLRLAGERGLHPSELAETLRVERASVTGLVDGIEREGLARRVASEEDRRSVTVLLTPKGRRFIDSLAPLRLRKVAELMCCLSAAEQKTLVKLLDRLNANMPAFRKI